jgi:hypothetical protein
MKSANYSNYLEANLLRVAVKDPKGLFSVLNRANS